MHNVPIPDEIELPCELCGNEVDKCTCPECPVCGVQGDINCYKQGHINHRYPQQCEQDGCLESGMPCWYPGSTGDPDCYYCHEHIHRAGFCWGCGTFWGGCESFEFTNPHHLCDNCASNPDYNWDLREEYDDDGYEWESEPCTDYT